MTRSAVLVLAAVLGLGTASVPVYAAAAEPQLKFRGAGANRVALDAMHLTTFDRGLLANLSDWSGEAVKPEQLDGKPVLIITWAGWHKVSHPAVRRAQALAQKYKDNGLVVIGVHNPTGFDKAAETAKTLGVTFPYAADKDGKFRSAIKADQDPNLYVIDRAGHLRYAQVDTASLDEAIAHVVGESAEDAKGLPERLKAAAAEADRQSRATRNATGLAPGNAVEVAVPEFEDDVYKKAKWPVLVGKVEKDKITDRINNDPPKINNWPEEHWIPSVPNRAGKIAIVYFVDPQLPDSLAIIPHMNRIRDRYPRDVVVTGFIIKRGVGGMDQNNQNSGDQNKLMERNTTFMQSMLSTRSVNHFLNPSQLTAENLEFNNETFQVRTSASRTEWGLAVLLSTDLRIRWLGNPYSNEMIGTLERLFEVDPAVAARRKLEGGKAP